MDFSNPIQLMAFILLVVVAIKIAVILIKPKAWTNGVVKRVWAKPKLMMIISLVLALYTLFLLVNNGVTIVEIFATMLFFSLLAAVGVAIYSKEVISLAQKLTNKSIVKKSWLYLIIWIALIIWGFYALFA